MYLIENISSYTKLNWHYINPKQSTRLILEEKCLHLQLILQSPRLEAVKYLTNKNNQSTHKPNIYVTLVPHHAICGACAVRAPRRSRHGKPVWGSAIHRGGPCPIMDDRCLVFHTRTTRQRRLRSLFPSHSVIFSPGDQWRPHVAPIGHRTARAPTTKAERTSVPTTQITDQRTSSQHTHCFRFVLVRVVVFFSCFAKWWCDICSAFVHFWDYFMLFWRWNGDLLVFSRKGNLFFCIVFILWVSVARSHSGVALRSDSCDSSASFSFAKFEKVR